jgi:hypothetical protein
VRLRLSLSLSRKAAAAALGSMMLLGAHGARASAPAFDVSGQSSTLMASSMQVAQFAYVGPSAFTTGTGTATTVLEFTLTSATGITALKSFVPCHDVGDGLQLIYVVESAGASVTGDAQLFASEVIYTDAGGAHDWTVANPPPSTGLLDDGVTLTGIHITALASSMPSLTLTGERTYAAFCGTGGPAAPAAHSSPSPTPVESPTAPSGSSPIPTASPTVMPAPVPMPEPVPTPDASPAASPSPTPDVTPSLDPSPSP